MNFRSLPVPSRCTTILARWNQPPTSLSLRSARRSSIRPITASVVLRGPRSGKTKTVTKLKDLPQGKLEPLPSDVIEEHFPARQYSPTLQGHLNNMHRFPGCVILTRVGDFYELYFDQVELYAPLLGLKRAKRSTQLGDIPMAGFQHTALDKYLKILVHDHELKVAISTQRRIDEASAEGAEAGKTGNMYERKVERIVTPATLIDESFNDPLKSCYLLAVHFEETAMTGPDSNTDEIHQHINDSTKLGLSWIDTSSGEFFTQVSDLMSLPSLIARIGPREVILDSSMEHNGQLDLQKLLGEATYALQFQPVTRQASSLAEWTDMLERPIPEHKHNEFTAAELAAGNMALNYIRENLQDNQNIRLQCPVRRADNEFMTIDKQSLRGLEITSLIRDGSMKGSLLHTIRRTVTSSGARLLRERLLSPSLVLSVIDNRLDLMHEILENDAFREDIVALLGKTSDTYRLLTRFSINNGDADDLLGLARTVQVMAQISEILHEHILGRQDSDASRHQCLWDLLERMDIDEPRRVANAILDAIDEDGLTRQHTLEAEGSEEAEDMTEEVEIADASGEKGPKLAKRAAKVKNDAIAALISSQASENDIWIMHRNASPTLKQEHRHLRTLSNAKQDLTQRLRDELQADSLTLRWTSKAGHHCALKGTRDIRADISKLDGARNVQTLKTTRTFTFDEWTLLGMRIDSVKLKIRVEEGRVLGRLRGQVIENIMRLRRNAAVLDELDVACSSAIVAKERNLVRPVLNNSTTHNIIGGRHPTVDFGLKERGRHFTANDCSLSEIEKIQLITGPNMAGKSTFLRQIALITILAQTGCFVPAAYAEIGLVDKIFSRVGSADNLYQDQSTFMVEMLETSEILKQATPRSFVIMDEVGRGTTPEAGIAVGYSTLHHLHYVNKCRCLFATHFHALADMTQNFGNIGYWCTDVEELDQAGKEWTYVHKLRQGVNRNSHALKVAEMAGMPQEAVVVARGVLADLRMKKAEEDGLESQQRPPMVATG